MFRQTRDYTVEPLKKDGVSGLLITVKPEHLKQGVDADHGFTRHPKFNTVYQRHITMPEFYKLKEHLDEHLTCAAGVKKQCEQFISSQQLADCQPPALPGLGH